MPNPLDPRGLEAQDPRLAAAARTGELDRRIAALERRLAAAGSPFVGQLAASATTTAPAGWLVCDGRSLLRADYALLFAVIGTTFGSADGTHFNLPDLRGRVPVALDNQGGSDAGRLAAANTLGGTGGAERVTLSAAESGLPAHSHAHTISTAGGSTTDGGAIPPHNSVASSTQTMTDTSTAAPASSSHENMPPYLLTAWVIYAAA